VQLVPQSQVVLAPATAPEAARSCQVNLQLRVFKCGCIGDYVQFDHIQGQWSYKTGGGKFKASGFNSLTCGCDVQNDGNSAALSNGQVCGDRQTWHSDSRYAITGSPASSIQIHRDIAPHEGICPVPGVVCPVPPDGICPFDPGD
jgi:hypothetical protein